MDKIVQIDGVFSNAVNFAMQQNYIPMIRQLLIKNVTSQELHNLTVTVSTDPSFITDWKTEISVISPEQTIEMNALDIHISASSLYGMTEGLEGSIIVTVSQGEKILDRHIQNISVLAYDEWSGANIIPEMISAFVTPNHPYVTEIVRNAGALLQKWDGDPSFTGYQKQNPNAVRRQMAAIYGALQQENIAYCMPPASFEQIGQRIRMCDAIKGQKLGTCIDLTLLYAACLEYVGLNPIIVFMKNHAFVGCWLENENFPECVQDDSSMLSKRIAHGINEICLVESTCFVADKNIDFENAVSIACEKIADTENFDYFVDIKRCRGSRIRPLPVRSVGADGKIATLGEDVLENNVTVTNAPSEVETTPKIEYAEHIEISKQQLWERKLLDLSLRNTLVNFRVTKNSIQLLTDSLSALEDALSCGEEFGIMQCPADFSNGLRDGKIYINENNSSLVGDLLKNEFENHRIRTFLDEKSLAGAIKGLYRSAKSSLEENGANTLYLAFGFLKWYESDISEKERYAPLVLIPIDIVRKSAQKGYVIRVRDEDPQFNITLLEWLRTEFGLTVSGLDPLPHDARGIDLNLTFNIIRQAIMGKSRWDVEEIAFIGVFSFSRFIMWNDIRNRVDDLKQNKVVASLMSGMMEWKQEASFPEIDKLDEILKPIDTAIPVSADSSQMAAICAAGNGNTFVLHGPPGTGKSQTITNMIANALYQGKSVLFIAEKMAALSVVQRRLANIGLAPFCLDVHSNKAKKKEVLTQLDRTLNVGRIKKPEKYTEQADRLYSLRVKLNDAVYSIHKQQNYGFSLYDAIVRMEQYKDYPDCVTFTAEQVNALTPEQYLQWVDICGELTAAGQGCSGVYNNALREISISEYSQALKIDIAGEFSQLLTNIALLRNNVESFSASIGAGNISSYRQLQAVNDLCKLFETAQDMPSCVLENDQLQSIADKIDFICGEGQKRDEIEAQLLKDFAPSVFELDSEALTLEWQQAQKSWFLSKMISESKVVKKLKALARSPKTYNKENTANILSQITEYKASKKTVDDHSAMLSGLFGILWNSGKCNWNELRSIYDQAVAIQKAIAAIAEIPEFYTAILSKVKNIFGSSVSAYREGNRDALSTLTNSFAAIIAYEKSLSGKIGFDFDTLHRDNWLACVEETASRLNRNIDGLRDWCSYVGVRDKANSVGLTSLVDALESGKITEQDVVPVFIRNISQSCALTTTAADKNLSSFSGSMFEQEIQKYRDTCSEFESLTRQELVARLSANIPVLSEGVSGSSEIGILQRAIKSGGRGVSIRKLFDSIPNLLRKLCPCMLMSPISVAQYIDPKYPKFDLVIFDEASQLPTCEAVGAIARGKELVVVGDPKQLPPTSFFAANHVDEENFEKEDLESVLDDCLALSMPQEHLLWHYRSRHESLIAFSNREYYENKLYTFPSPNDMVSEVKHIAVEGYYDRGKTKQNKAEAEAIVKEIIRRLSDSQLQKMSMGVVTFSVVQQHLIEDMLEEEFSKHPELDELNSASQEPLFVKNLENVQGDERDVIMFSIGYGPDTQGKVALNFGPLNRDGGWRRLNVAVSRARRQMLVFSVLRPEQIDLGKTRSDGLAGLKAFLEFAIRGKSALNVKKSDSEHKSGIEESVATRLRKEGINAVTNIGCSEYKIDIGIVDPNNEGEYILGILCDGEKYSNSGTARDRNILQESVLKSLGWNIHRVWTLDWWENSEKEVSKIRSAIEKALVKKGDEIEIQPQSDPVRIEEYERITEVENLADLPKYKVCTLPTENELFGNTDAFSKPQAIKKIGKQIETVLQIEAPISRNLLFKRIFEAWGITRKSPRIEATLDSILDSMSLTATVCGENKFYWAQGQQVGSYCEFRVPTDDEKSKRSIDEIVVVEVAAAVRHIVQLQISLSEDDLVHEVAALFGISRCTANVQAFIKQGISMAIEREYVCVQDGRISMCYGTTR